VIENASLKSILLLAANPKGTYNLRLQEEEREIRERLRLAGYGKVPINSTGATRPRDVQQAILDFKPQVVHFSGHGAGQDGLVLEDASGQEKLVSSEALANLFKLFSKRIECVILNACYAKFQAEAISKHIDYVIAMGTSISDSAAIEFSIGFYTALGAGESIEFAYELGCNAIHLEGIPEYLTPILYCKGIPNSPSNDSQTSSESDLTRRNNLQETSNSRYLEKASEAPQLQPLQRIVHADSLWLRSILEVPFFEPLFELIKQDKYWAWRETLLSEISRFPYAHQVPPLEASRLICNLIHQIKPSSPWEIRRAMGNCLGESWSCLHPKVAAKEVSRISEEIDFKWESQILIATAIGKANLLIEQDYVIASKILSAKHPQVRWQIAKEWDALQQNESFTLLLEDSDEWVIKRFMISTLNAISKDPKNLSNQSKVVISKYLSNYANSSEGVSFLRLLDLWLCKNYEFSFLQESLSTPLVNINTMREFSGDLNYKMHRFIEDPKKLATSLDLLCLDIELAKPSASKPLGRYETISNWVQSAIEESYLFGNLSEVFSELMKCHDEGIRWAVAHSLPNLFQMRTHLFYEIAYKLLQDDNNWTVSETLRNLAKIKGIEHNELFKLAQEAHSWIKAVSLLKGLDYIHEVQVAFSELLDSYPRLREKFRFSIDLLS
jgi:hypothetical protein